MDMIGFLYHTLSQTMVDLMPGHLDTLLIDHADTRVPDAQNGVHPNLAIGHLINETTTGYRINHHTLRKGDIAGKVGPDAVALFIRTGPGS